MVKPMLLKLKTAPSAEPLDLLTVKTHLRLDSQSLADNLTSTQSIAPGSHVIAALYSLVGTGVDVQGYRAVVYLEAGTCGTGGTVAVKVQESDDNVSFTDWSTAFTTVTEANDNATQEKEYTGSKRYIRVVATVATASCEFGVSVVKSAPYSVEDTYLTALIIVARKYVEELCGPLITQTWEQYEDDWPSGDRLGIGKQRLLTVTDIVYTDEDEADATFAVASYSVDIINEFKPGVVLKDDYEWPTTSLFNLNPIKITFTCGYGAAASSIPETLRHAMLLLISHWFEERQPVMVSMSGGATVLPIPFAVDALLMNYRIFL